MHVAAARAQWSKDLARRVAMQTTAPDASLRRAAYRALLMRDPAEHPCAWLGYEVVFDRDPTVRRLAR